jgi:heme A synthase
MMEAASMRNPWLFRLAILVAVCALLLIVDGAMVGPGTQPTPQLMSAHRTVATVVSVLTLGLVLWLIFTDPRPQARRLGWLTLLIAVLQDSVGHAAVFAMVPRTAGIVHALMAPLFFSAAVSIAVVTSPGWSRGPEYVRDYGWPSMRSLAILTPILVVLQILLGAAFRQQALSLLPHVLGAMFVALVILLESIFLLQQFPTHRALAPAAKTLLAVAFAQVFLGITALIMKSMANDTDLAVILTVASHVTGGAITLATTVVVSFLIRRNVQPKIEEDTDEPAST